MSKIKLEEGSKKAVFINEDRHEYKKIRVDGCVISNSTAADWVLSKEGTGFIVLELKGRKIETAIAQIKATLSYWRDQGHAHGRMAALVVSNQVPKATIAQRAMQEFAKAFQCPIHLVSHNQEYVFENVLSFKGPNKR